MPSKPDYTRAVDDDKAADEIFGAPDAPPTPPASPNMIARPISIFDIQPDLAQPRRLLPGALRYDRPIMDILQAWWDMAQEEAGTTIALNNILLGHASERTLDTDPQSERKPGPIEIGFLKLVDLAATIRDKGLINPVTIYRPYPGEDLFRLETGERRWLAHHLLAVVFGGQQWGRISAFEVKVPSIWRQAHENTLRDNLNAISLARQFALLVMYIYTEMGLEFQPYEMFQHDRHFYAQVEDGREYPIPPGEAEKVASAMGGKSVNQIRQYRGLLRLPDHLWSEADMNSTDEKPLRDMMKTLRILDHELSSGDTSSASVQTLDTVTGVTPDGVDSEDEEKPQGHVWEVGGQVGLRVEVRPGAAKHIHAVHLGTIRVILSQSEAIIETDDGARGVLNLAFVQPLVEHHEPETGNEESASDQLPDWVLRMLKWAHRRATSGGNAYFSASNVGAAASTLNKLIAQGLLEGKSERENTNLNAAFYRIAPGGCAVIGESAITYPEPQTPNHLPPGADQPGFVAGQTQPISEGQARAGNGQQSGSPPRHRSEGIFTPAERHILFAVVGLQDDRLDTADGLQEVIAALEQAIAIQHRKLTELRNKQ